MKKFIATLMSAVLLCGSLAGLTACGDAPCAHKYEEDTQKTVAATCHSDGNRYLVCTECGDEKTEAITERPAHNLGDGENSVWVKSDGEYHAKGCIVDGCDYIDVENKEAHAFVLNEAEKPNPVPATCHSDGIRYLVCVCGEKKTEAITERPDHDYGEAESVKWVSVDENSHARQCIVGGCGNVDGEHSVPHNFVSGEEGKMVCGDCAYEKEASAELMHIQGDTLVYSVDGTTHWYPCVNPEHVDCEAKFEEEAHDYNTELTEQGVPATCKQDGKKVMACDCGATEEVIIDKSTVAHTWDGGEETKTATCIEKGEKTYTCTVCGETKTEETDKAPHNFGEWGKSDETHHARYCANDGCGEAEMQEHSWVDNVEKEATFWEEGKKTCTCTVCDESKEETIARKNSTTTDINDANWKFGTVDYNFSGDTFTFTQATDKNGNNDGYIINGTEIKNTWFLGANFDSFICIAYTFEEAINANISVYFKGIGGDDGVLSDYSVRFGYNDGANAEWGDRGTEYTVNKTHSFNAGDTVYLIFKHEANGWDQGNYSVTINRVD